MTLRDKVEAAVAADWALVTDLVFWYVLGCGVAVTLIVIWLERLGVI